MAQWVRVLAACSSRGHGFDSQQPHGSLPLSLLEFEGIQYPSGTYVLHRHTCRQNTYTPLYRDSKMARKIKYLLLIMAI